MAISTRTGRTISNFGIRGNGKCCEESESFEASTSNRNQNEIKVKLNMKIEHDWFNCVTFSFSSCGWCCAVVAVSFEKLTSFDQSLEAQPRQPQLTHSTTPSSRSFLGTRLLIVCDFFLQEKLVWFVIDWQWEAASKIDNWSETERRKNQKRRDVKQNWKLKLGLA